MPSHRRRTRRAIAAAGVVVLVALLLTGDALLGRPGSVGTGAVSPAVGLRTASSAGLQVTVTWDGVSIAGANSAPDAFALAPGQTVSVVFTFRGAAANATPTNASLLLRYFGTTLSTEGTVPTVAGGAGRAVVNWTFGSLLEVIQGVYEVVAQLTDANGSMLFSEPFYINAQAPFVIGSAIAVFGIVLAGAEAYWIVVVVRTRGGRRWRSRPR